LILASGFGLCHRFLPSFSQRVTGKSRLPYRDISSSCSTPKRMPKGHHRPEEDLQAFIPAQYTVHQFPPCFDDLARQQHEVRRTLRFSLRRRSFQRPPPGINKANHAFSVHAKDAITIYAQLLTSPSTGSRIACTPFFNCAIRFS